MKVYSDQMEKPLIMFKYGKRNYWFVFLVLLLCCFYYALFAGNNSVVTLFSRYSSSWDPIENPNETSWDSQINSSIPIVENTTELTRVNMTQILDSRSGTENPNETSWNSRVNSPLPTAENTTELTRVNMTQNLDSCSGRYIYVHDLPSRFNHDILSNCSSLNKWHDMCQHLLNKGLGPRAANSEGVLQNRSWYVTSQFTLEVIFHNRMKQYECLTNDSSLASAIYVPYYAGLDVGRYLWDMNTFARDSASLDLVQWLSGKPEWRSMYGKDHFFVAGRVTWDFRRHGDNYTNWGNKLMLLPEAKNMTMLAIESSPWSSNDFAIPYPTYFHPSTDREVFRWQSKLKRQKRRYLFSFIGAARPTLQDSIRGQIIKQCLASKRKCRLLDCSSRKCYNPVHVMKMFQKSTFCLQPSGDSYTRRSMFDSILAGCIPVFFHPGSAYVQYIWHLPKNYTKYSVFIPENSIRDGKASIEKTLLKISKDDVLAMRQEVIRLIPRVIYADPRSRLENIEDAFDIAVKGVLERVGTIRRDTKEGRSSNIECEEDNSWKYYLFGTEKKHEWDYFFSKSKQEN
ncbi:probable xyloglucan galactosyltransferase GT12 [Cornus florida]|uniref:probable xyloglucan galactosyltransferase GT12 n=1 Tax=Cornus florida TaxID=4283 RepID=UPI00289CCDF1|nr:probable xyloglucan galactosyltransferase GT12 [Cornus florida]